MQIRKIKLIKNQVGVIAIYLVILALLQSCSNSRSPLNSKHNDNANKTEVHKKPPASFKDSLKIQSKVAVFYQADTFQLQKIKGVTTPQIYEGSMHEYYYLTRNAHLVLKKNWKQINILEAKNVRYLDFIKENNSHKIIDLDNFNDAYGLFIFDGKKDPVLVDMANLEEALYFYFSK